MGSRRRAALARAGVLAPVTGTVHDLAPLLTSVTALDPAATRRPSSVEELATATRDLGAGGRSGGGLLTGGPDHRRRRAAWLALLALGPDRAVATGLCALALYGIQGLPALVVPEAALPGGPARRPGGGIVVRRSDPGPVTVVRGARASSVPVAAAAAVCTLPRDRAVAVLDSALQQGLLTEDQLDRVRGLTRGRRGAARAAGWWDLVDGRAQSPLETAARLQCVDAGVPPHDLQVAVRDATGRVVARGDLGWRHRSGRLLVVEIDGAGPHGTPQALYRDRARQNDVLTAGALLLRFTAADVSRRRVAEAVLRHVTPLPQVAP